MRLKWNKRGNENPIRVSAFLFPPKKKNYIKLNLSLANDVPLAAYTIFEHTNVASTFISQRDFSPCHKTARQSKTRSEYYKTITIKALAFLAAVANAAPSLSLCNRARHRFVCMF